MPLDGEEQQSFSADGEARSFPNNIEAEQAVLGALLVNNDVLSRIGFLREEQFYDPLHGATYEQIKGTIDGGGLASPITLKHWANSEPAFESLGGPTYLLRLADSAVTVFDVVETARAIVDTWARRQIIYAAEEAADLAGGASDPQEIASVLDSRLLSLDFGRDKGRYRFAESARVTIDRVAEAYRADGRPIGLLTGLNDLDKLIRGFRRGNLVVVAGRPSMGKSAFAGAVALSCAQQENPFHLRVIEDGDDGEPRKCGVIIISLEMTEEEFVTRIVSDSMRRNGQKLPYSDAFAGFIDTRDRNAEREEREMREWVTALRALERLPISIADLPAQSPLPLILSEIRRRAAMLADAGAPVGLIIVDHLGLIQRPPGRDNEASRIGQLTSAMKGLAKRSQCAVMLLSQLNRAVESREDKRPMLSDLRDSGTIEQDADVVLFPFRQEHYLAQDEPPHSLPVEHEGWEQEMRKWRGLAEVGVAKNRSGPLGRAMMFCDIACNHFSDLARSPDGQDDGGMF